MDPFIAIHKKQEQVPWLKEPPAEPEWSEPPEDERGRKSRHRWLWPLTILLLLMLLVYAHWRFDREEARRKAEAPPDVMRRAGEVNQPQVRDLIHGALQKRESEPARGRAGPAVPADRAARFDFSAVQASENKRQQGDVLMDLGKQDLALEAYVDALRLNPRHRKAWQSLARWYLAVEEDSMAQVCLETAMALGAQDSALLNALSVIYRQQGRLDEALKLWDINRTLSQATPESDFNEALARLENGEVRLARQRIETYLAAHADDRTAVRMQAYTWAAEGEPLKSMMILKQALRRWPREAALHADAAAAAALAWLPELAVEHLAWLTNLTSPEVVGALLREPAFSEFIQTDLGRAFESGLQTAGRGSTLSRPRLLDPLRLDLAPQRTVY